MSYAAGALPELNLDELETLTDQSRIVEIARNLMVADSAIKYLPSRQWLENFLYYHGLRTSAASYLAPTVVNNTVAFPQRTAGSGVQKTIQRRISKVFKAVQVQAANFTRQRPSIKVWPLNDDNDFDNKKAKLSNILLDYLWKFDHEDDIYYQIILWSLLTPAVARKDYLDYSYNASRVYPRTELVLNEYTGKQEQRPILDELGRPMFEQHPWNATDVIPAMRLMSSFNSTWLHDVDWMGDSGWKRLNWIKSNFAKDEPYYFPENVEKIKAGPWSFTYMMAMETALKSLAFGVAPSWNRGPNALGYGFPFAKDQVTYINLFIQPSPNYPNGREIFVANDFLLYDGPSRAWVEFPQNWHPYSITCYERVPCRLFGTSYAEKITDINRAYEQGRTELDELRRTFSKPKMAIPIGAQIERDTVTGMEEIFRYNPFAADGGKPFFLNPAQPPTTILDDLKLTSSDFIELSGVTEIMQGIRPQGVSTYRGMEVLREEAANAANNFIRMGEDLIARSQYLKLENIRKSLRNPDYNLTKSLKVFKRMTSYVTDIDVQTFTGDDLGGMVMVEPLSSLPKSKIALQEKYMALGQQGILGDIINDPELNTEFKRKLDVTGFERPQDKQVLFARYENQLMLTAEDRQAIINPPVMEFHDDAIHIREVDNLLLDPSLQDKQFVMQSLLAHKEAHRQNQAQKMMQQIQSQKQIATLGMGAGGPPAQAGGGKPTQQSGGNNNQPSGEGEGGVLFGPATGFSNQSIME